MYERYCNHVKSSSISCNHYKLHSFIWNQLQSPVVIKNHLNLCKISCSLRQWLEFIINIYLKSVGITKSPTNNHLNNFQISYSHLKSLAFIWESVLITSSDFHPSKNQFQSLAITLELQLSLSSTWNHVHSLAITNKHVHWTKVSFNYMQWPLFTYDHMHS